MVGVVGFAREVRMQPAQRDAQEIVRLLLAIVSKVFVKHTRYLLHACDCLEKVTPLGHGSYQLAISCGNPSLLFALVVDISPQILTAEEIRDWQCVVETLKHRIHVTSVADVWESRRRFWFL